MSLKDTNTNWIDSAGKRSGAHGFILTHPPPLPARSRESSRLNGESVFETNCWSVAADHAIPEVLSLDRSSLRVQPKSGSLRESKEF